MRPAELDWQLRWALQIARMERAGSAAGTRLGQLLARTHCLPMMTARRQLASENTPE